MLFYPVVDHNMVSRFTVHQGSLQWSVHNNSVLHQRVRKTITELQIGQIRQVCWEEQKNTVYNKSSPLLQNKFRKQETQITLQY